MWRRLGYLLLVVGGLLLLAAVILMVLLAADSGNDPASNPDQGVSPSLPPSETPLRESAAERKMLVGAAVTNEPLRDEARYGGLLGREFNTVTPENQMKWDTIHPERDRYDFRPADEIVEFAASNGMAVRGHTLVWYRQVPDWVNDREWTRPELERVLHDHIRRVVGHYRGKVAQWDVVNEAFDNDGELRDSVWSRVIGPDYIELAFRWANEADPDALLFYNDFDLEFTPAKADAVERLVRNLQADGVPIDGVGLQGHELDVRPPTRAQVASTLQRFAALGLHVGITELDVGVTMPSDPAKFERQAVIYDEMLAGCLAVRQCRTFVTWGFTDAHSWIPGELPGFGDALPFDADYEPKPAAERLRARLAGGSPDATEP